MSQVIRVGMPCGCSACDRFLDALARIVPDADVVTVPVWTSDDPLAEVPAGALDRCFEDALSDGVIDVYIAPMDTLPVIQDERVRMAAVMRRDDPSYGSTMVLDELSPGSTVLACNQAVANMLSEAYPDFTIVTEGPHDVAVTTMHMHDPDMAFLPLDPTFFIPAAGQGALAVMCRKDDTDTRSIASRVNHPVTRIEVSAEMAVMKLMGAVTVSPVGVNACMEDDAIRVRAVSYGYTPGPRRSDCYLPLDYVMDEVLSISEYLVGKRDFVL